MSLIDCKVELSLTWNKNCTLSSVANDSTFKITDTKLYVPVVTLKTEDNKKLSKLLREGFKRPIYWNEYRITSNKNYDANKSIRERLAYGGENDDATENSHRKYVLLRMKIKTITLKLMEEIFMSNQLMTWLSNTTKSEKYQQGKVMITQQVFY